MAVTGGQAIDWQRIHRREPATTKSGVLYWQTVYGYECTGCHQIRWGRAGDDRRPEGRCELCFPAT